jgi:hypothetical protein
MSNILHFADNFAFSCELFPDYKVFKIYYFLIIIIIIIIIIWLLIRHINKPELNWIELNYYYYYYYWKCLKRIFRL